MTAHELARRLLSHADAPIQTWDPDAGEWAEVTGYTYGSGPVQLHTDTEDAMPIGIEGLCRIHGGDDDPATCRECHPKDSR